MAHLAHVIHGFLIGAGAGLCIGLALTLVAETSDFVPVGSHPLGTLRFLLGITSIPIGLIAGGIWGGVVAWGGAVGPIQDALVLSARILGVTFAVVMSVIVVRLAIERPTSPDATGAGAISREEWRTERVDRKLLGAVQVFVYERHHSATGRRTVDVSIYPVGESVEALPAGNALVLDDPDGIGTSVGHRAFALQSESADVQLFYGATERVLVRQDRVGVLTVEFNHLPGPRPQHSRTPLQHGP